MSYTNGVSVLKLAESSGSFQTGEFEEVDGVSDDQEVANEWLYCVDHHADDCSAQISLFQTVDES